MEKGQERVGMTLMTAPTQSTWGVLSLMVGSIQLTWNLAASTSKEPSPLVCPGEAGWDLRDKRERLSIIGS